MNLHRSGAFGVLLLLASCSSKASAPTGQNTPVSPLDISDVIYASGATDDALRRLLDATPKDDARQYVVIDSPDINAPVPKDSSATLTFHLASQAAQVPALRVKPERLPTPAWQRSFHELLQLLGPPRVAHAHGTPYNGTAYFLVFTDADSKRMLRFFTGQTSYAPDTDTWQTLAQAAQPLSLEISSAFFEENEIPEDGGPFIGGKFQFRIQ